MTSETTASQDMLGAAPSEPRPDSPDVPLIVDLDGTLIKTDLLIETFFALLTARPLAALRSIAMLRNGKAQLKAELADHAMIDLRAMPFDEDVLAYVRAEKAKGRKVYLASASDQKLVDDIAAHVGLFDGAFGSGNGVNLGGRRKAEKLCQMFGERGFDYIGNAAVDCAVWDCCRTPVVANAPSSLRRKTRARYGNAHEIGGLSMRVGDYGQAIRVHQWLKNLLVFVPLFAAHAFDLPTLIAAAVAFAAFSLCASSVYLLNDLLDLDNDRNHPSKRLRSLASGRVPLLHGMLLAPVLLLASLLLALLLPVEFIGVLGAYYAVTLLYSTVLKRRMLVDVIALSVLYTLRIFAGSVSVGIPISPWLMAFSTFLFLCLAIIKRYTELEARARTGESNPPGRGYVLSDLPMLGSLGAASGYGAVMVLALYINSPEVHTLYKNPSYLWLVCLLLLYWVSRALMIAHRGAMHDDPVIFAVKDRISLVVGALVLTVVALSA